MLIQILSVKTDFALKCQVVCNFSWSPSTTEELAPKQVAQLVPRPEKTGAITHIIIFTLLKVDILELIELNTLAQIGGTAFSDACLILARGPWISTPEIHKMIHHLTPACSTSHPIYTRFSFVHDDVIKWNHFPHHWPFVRGIHRSPVISPHKGQWRGALMFSLICALSKRLSKQSRGWWFETQSRSFWRHCNVIGLVLSIVRIYVI